MQHHKVILIKLICQILYIFTSDDDDDDEFVINFPAKSWAVPSAPPDAFKKPIIPVRRRAIQTSLYLEYKFESKKGLDGKIIYKSLLNYSFFS